MLSAAFIALSVLWLGLIAYAVLGGADFGAGIWDLFALGPLATRQRHLVNHALGPVWEANHVWLIFLLMGLFTVFPSAFSILSIALFVPLTIVLVGIVLRGAAFMFRTYATDSTSLFARVWSRIFSTSSLITPFFLGASAAAVASGRIRVVGGVAHADLGPAWTSSFALAVGAMAVSLCATLAAVYLIVEAKNEHDDDLTESYRLKAMIAGAITAVFGGLALLLSPTQAPLLWQGMLAQALPIVILTMIIGLATAYTLFARYYHAARILIVLESAFLLGSWGVSQLPYLIPPDVTINSAANAPEVIITLLIATAIGMALLIPSLYYLFSVFKLTHGAPEGEKQKVLSGRSYPD